MAYQEVKIKIAGDIQTGREITIAQLAEAGYESFEETPEGVNAYIPENKYDEKAVKSLVVMVNDLFKGSGYSSGVIKTVNWNQEWEKNYEPVEVGKFCYIRALFHPESGKHRHEIIIQPKMSFGTGHHSTTWLMINAMEKIDLNNKKVLDLGCGTGVLSILASRKGAKEVDAIDIDEWSVTNSIENISLNRAANITVTEGDISAVSPGKSYDIILANITRNILTGYMENFHELLNRGGVLLISGFFRSDLEGITEKAGETGFKPVGSNSKKEWTVAQFNK